MLRQTAFQAVRLDLRLAPALQALDIFRRRVTVKKALSAFPHTTALLFAR